VRFCLKTAVFQTSHRHSANGFDVAAEFVRVLQRLHYDKVVGYHVTGLEGTGDLAFLHLTGLD